MTLDIQFASSANPSSYYEKYKRCGKDGVAVKNEYSAATPRYCLIWLIIREQITSLILCTVVRIKTYFYCNLWVWKCYEEKKTMAG